MIFETFFYREHDISPFFSNYVKELLLYLFKAPNQV
jgi:hypothetical protein